MNGAPILSLAEYTAWERRAWHSAWADRGLLLKNMAPEDARSVRELDEECAAKMRRVADPEC